MPQINNLISTVKEIADLLALDSTSTVNLNPVVERLVQGLRYRRAFVLLYRPHTESLVASASSGLNIADFRKLDTRSETGVLRNVFDRPEATVTVKIADEPSLSFLDDGDGAGSLLIVPIKSGKKCIGLLCAQPNDEPDDANDQNGLLELIAAM